jgi:hypothetical protein
MTPGDRVAQLHPQALGTHFSRLLRHAWVTLGLFFNPGHHTGTYLLIIYSKFNISPTQSTLTVGTGSLNNLRISRIEAYIQILKHQTVYFSVFLLLAQRT